MEWQRITKRNHTAANLKNYEESISAFSWPQSRALLDGLPVEGKPGQEEQRETALTG
jgi:hypothetical protein